MQRRYLIEISRNPVAPAGWFTHREKHELGEFTVSILSPDGPATRDWSCDVLENGHTLAIVDGAPIPLQADSRPLPSGIFNRFTINGADGKVTLANDVVGMLPCYYIQQGDRVLITNSVRLAREHAGLSVDNLGLAEHFLFSYGIGGRTIAAGLRWLPPGSELRLDIDGREPPRFRRLTKAWTSFNDDSLENTIRQFGDLWGAAIERALGPVSEPIGLMLSGGLDSRMVAGALTSLGKPGLWLNHGNQASDEARIAGLVAGACGRTLLRNGLDDTFPLERLALPHTSLRVEALVNPIWDSSARMLREHGIADFTTGAGFDEILGGYKDQNARRRLFRNIRHATIGLPKPRRATDQEVRAIGDEFIAAAAKRLRNHARLLAEPYRSLVADAMQPLSEAVREQLAAYAAEPIAAEQVSERFMFEQLLRQWTAVQERQLRVHGRVHVPTYDRDLFEFIANLPPGVRYDHHLYYRVLRRLYPDLARLPVTNLGTSINRSQLAIEWERARRIARNKRLSTWVNFDQWVRKGSRLAEYEQLFLDNDHFFDSDAIRERFDAAREGRASLYDGNEMNNFLNLAYLLNPEAK